MVDSKMTAERQDRGNFLISRSVPCVRCAEKHQHDGKVTAALVLTAEMAQFYTLLLIVLFIVYYYY